MRVGVALETAAIRVQLACELTPMSDWRAAPVGRPPPFRMPLNCDERAAISDGTSWAA